MGEQLPEEDEEMAAELRKIGGWRFLLHEGVNFNSLRAGRAEGEQAPAELRKRGGCWEAREKTANVHAKPFAPTPKLSCGASLPLCRPAPRAGAGHPQAPTQAHHCHLPCTFQLPHLQSPCCRPAPRAAAGH